MLSYSELMGFESYEDRLNYLRTDSLPGEMTFGAMRPINQAFYQSRLWKLVRKQVLARDLGNDLALPNRPIHGRAIVHHINPLQPKDLYLNQELALDPDNLITVSNDTHLAIHFGFEPVETLTAERFKGDTKLW